MIIFNSRILALSCALMLLSLNKQVLASDCQSQLKAFNQAASLIDVAAISKAFEIFNVSNRCSATQKHKARRATANRLFSVAYKGVDADMAESDVDQLLELSETIAPTWRALSFLGSRDHGAGRYGLAARRLQRALALIDDSFETPTAPSEKTIESIHQLAAESLLLADEFVPPPQVRGVASGVLAETVRGFSVQRAPLPISFKTGSTDFSPQGAKAAEALFLALRNQNTSAIEIIGHADERGSEKYNLALSLARAEKVQQWLLGKGLQLDVQASGRGESQPLVLSSAGAYSTEQRWQLNRRVELIRLAPAH